MAKKGWLKFDGLMIKEDKIVGVIRKKNKVTIHLVGGQEFSLSKSEGIAFWEELSGETKSGPIELTEIVDGSSSSADNSILQQEPQQSAGGRKRQRKII